MNITREHMVGLKRLLFLLACGWLFLGALAILLQGDLVGVIGVVYACIGLIYAIFVL